MKLVSWFRMLLIALFCLALHLLGVMSAWAIQGGAYGVTEPAAINPTDGMAATTTFLNPAMVIGLGVFFLLLAIGVFIKVVRRGAGR